MLFLNGSVNRRMRSFLTLALAVGFLAPVTLAQKPPSAPPPPPPSAPPGRSTNPAAPNSQPTQPSERQDLVMFLLGRVTTSDGTPLPNDALIERVCNAGVRQQVHVGPRGEFSMQLGSKADSYLDASGDDRSQDGRANQNSQMGIPRHELANCDLRASVSGFSSSVISLVDLSGSLSTVDVGGIVVQRRTKIEGATLSASAYLAPKGARKAYEKGLDSQKKGSLADAQKYFATAVELYPKYTNAWFQLGTVLQKEQQIDAARAAFTRATAIDSRFLPPYLSLSFMAYQAGDWTEVLNFTDHILDLDPLNHVSGYVWDLDSLNYTEAYFYNAVANYKLNKFEKAEKMALKAEQVDVPTHFAKVHLLLAELFARKNDYTTAISQIQTYLEIVPHAQDAEQAREQLAKLEKLNSSVSSQ